MNEIQLRALIDDAIRKATLYIDSGHKHSDYEETVRLAKLYKQLITGRDIKSLLPQFIFGEDDKLYEQRIALTVENLKPSFAPALAKFFNIFRTPIQKAVKVKNNEDKQKSILDAESKFFQNMDVVEYIKNILSRFMLHDPNAFCVVDFKPFDPSIGQKPMPYPIIFTSEEVLDFGYATNGELDYVWTVNSSVVYVRDDKAKTITPKPVTDFYYWGKGFCIEFIQHLEKNERQIPIGEDSIWKSQKDKTYSVFIKIKYSTKAQIDPIVQPFRLGYIASNDRPNICVSPIDNATSIGINLIRSKSNYDILLLLHNFPTPMMRGKPCPGEISIDPLRTCSNGTITGTTEQCKTCQGYGRIFPTSPQHMILIPDEKDENGKLTPMKEFYDYLSKPIDSVKMTKEEIISCQNAILLAIFSNDATKQAGAYASQISDNGNPTATSILLKKDETNNTLKPFADMVSSIWKHIILCTGQFFDVTPDTFFEFTTQRFEPLTKEDIAMELKTLTDSNADYVLLAETRKQLAEISFNGDPSALKLYKAKSYTMPFLGVKEIDAVLNSNFAMKRSKIAYLYFDEIWRKLLLDEPEIVELKPSEIIKKFDVVLDEFVNTISEENKADLPVIGRGITFQNSSIDKNQNPSGVPQPQPTTPNV